MFFTITPILLLLFIGIVGIIWSIALLLPVRKNVVTERLEQMKVTQERRIKKEVLPILHKILKYVTDLLPAPQEKKVSRYRNLLVLAGFRSRESARIFYGVKLILTVALPVVFLFSGFRFFDAATGILITAILAFIGFILVDGYLSYKVRTRQEEIFHNMPDVLDLLAIIVEAGMGLDAALRRVSEEHVFSKTPLAMELRQIVSEMTVGLPRIDALRNLYKRTGLDDIKALTDILIQSEKFGTSVSQALKGFAESQRTKRRQIAEELAAKTAIKLVFPLVLCIFPALFVVLLGPAVISIYKALIQ
jgi:tight adherence protein C